MGDGDALTLYERLGGADGVAGAVAELYDRILADPELAPFFEAVEVEAVQEHQRALVTAATGGASEYAGRPLREAHEGLAISARHLDLLFGHLRASLAAVGAAPADAQVLVGLMERLWRAQWWGEDAVGT